MIHSTTFDTECQQKKGWTKMVRPIQISAEDELEFQLAIEAYKSSSGRNFPTWSEILEVIRSLGYAKRIWKPVGGTAPIAAPGPGNGSDSVGPLGDICWFSRVETPVGP